MSSTDAEVLSLLERLLDVEGLERATLLRELTMGRPTLRARLETLLERDEQDHPLLDGDAAPLDRALRGESAPDASLSFETAPVPIPGYRMVRELGRGGMGVVYLAERTNVDFEQQVALKIIAAHPDSAALAERLRRERRILARLRHPNIAQLYDGGVTPSGLPFLVMEYIEGERIDEWCDARRLDVATRARLIMDACAAVEHLHEQLIVHGDLKPANMLVTRDGVVKLLDFGIARTIAADAGAAATQTRLTGFTPGYASPEQLRNQDVTPASDVYALGVILYELITGAAPFATSGDAFETARAVLETDAVPPDEAVLTAEAVAARAATPERLRRTLRGDLAAIVLHAISRRPEDRYPDPRGLREDLERWLTHQPVLAQRPSRIYRLRTFARRHRPVLVAGLVAVTLGASATVIALTAADEPAGVVAYDRLLRGDIYLSARTPDDVLRAIAQYAAAAAEAPASAEPRFREAYAWLIYSDWGWEHPTLDGEAILDRAEELTARGLEIAPRSAEGLLALGYLRALRDPDLLAGALSAFERSLAADDRNVEAWHHYGQSLMVLGRFDDAARAYERALQLEPRRAMTLVPLGAMALYERRYTEALVWSDSAVSVEPANSYARASRARILLAAGDIEAARAEAELAAGVDQGHALPVRATLAAVHAAAGDLERARAVHDAMPHPARDAVVSATDVTALAAAALAVGDTAHALDLLSRARPRGAWLRFYLRAPQFDPLRNHPEFATIAGT